MDLKPNHGFIYTLNRSVFFIFYSNSFRAIYVYQINGETHIDPILNF